MTQSFHSFFSTIKIKNPFYTIIRSEMTTTEKDSVPLFLAYDIHFLLGTDILL